jgi:hypothetical protein
VVSEEHDPIPRRLELRTVAAAARILGAQVGVRLATVVLGEVAVAQARGEPFRSLGPPVDDRERLCRRQVGPALLLQRALRRWLDADEAIEITKEVVVEGTVLFLRHSMGNLERAALMALAPEAREEHVRRLGARFFNAELRWDEISDEAVRFTVQRCCFPRLCEAGGAPEVAPLMCLGDAVYFGEVLGTVDLVRPTTLADGGDCCPFELRWRDDPDPEASGAS